MHFYISNYKISNNFSNFILKARGFAISLIYVSGSANNSHLRKNLIIYFYIILVILIANIIMFGFL